MLDAIFTETVSVGTILSLHEDSGIVFNLNDDHISEVIFEEEE